MNVDYLLEAQKKLVNISSYDVTFDCEAALDILRKGRDKNDKACLTFFLNFDDELSYRDKMSYFQFYFEDLKLALSADEYMNNSRLFPLNEDRARYVNEMALKRQKILLTLKEFIAYVGMFSPVRREYSKLFGISMEDISNFDLTNWVLVVKFGKTTDQVNEFWKKCYNEVNGYKIGELLKRMIAAA